MSSSTTLLAILAAVLATGGLGFIILWFTPARPSLDDAMKRTSLTGELDSSVRDVAIDTSTMTSSQRRKAALGQRFYGPVTSLPFVSIPTSDLAVLGKPPAVFLGDKLASAAAGFVLPFLLNALLSVMGSPIPWSLPAIASLVLALVFFVLPDIEVRNKAAEGRQEFRRTLGIYVDIVAMIQRSGVGGTQALEQAAMVGDSWVVRRIDATLQDAARAGRRPWNALKRLAAEITLKDLADVSDIVTLGSEQGTQVTDSLRAKARSLRNAMVNEAAGAESAKTKKLSVPLSLLAVLFIALLLVPALASFAAA